MATTMLGATAVPAGAAAIDMEAHGSELFRIRRIFSVGASAAETETLANGQPRLKIEAMAVHTHEKKQLLAMSIAEDCDAVASAVAAPAAASAPSAAPSIALGHLPAIEPRKSRLPNTSTAAALGGREAERKKQQQQQKQQAALSAASNYLLVRTIEEDERARFWKFPVYSTHKQQRAGMREQLVALEFSPEGDWLAGLSRRKNRLHLIPVRTLIARQRRRLLDAAAAPPPHRRELMSVEPSAMAVQMASYLRATNEAGGLNGARYHSQVAGDDAQMSVLAFAPGLGRATCLRWWRSLNATNYVLVGGADGLISVVNAEENAETCRCELQRAGAIVAIDLVHERFRTETRTSMLVTARSADNDSSSSTDAPLQYYRVVLEKKVQRPVVVPPTTVSTRSATEPLTDTTTTPPSSFSSASGTPSFTTANSAVRAGSSSAVQYVVRTFPQHFLEDVDFRPQRLVKHAPARVALFAINGPLTSESSIARLDAATHRARLYSNFQWTLRHEYVVPSLAPISRVNTANTVDTNNTVGDDDDRVEDIEIAYCTTDLLLLQGRTARTHRNVATWVSLPSHSAMEVSDDSSEQVARAHIVHHLALHGNERIERVVQSTASSRTAGVDSRTGSAMGPVRDASGDDAQVTYLLQTAHSVYECRPQWSRLALFRALCAQTIALASAQSIGYALGIDMASLCQVAAETLSAHIQGGRSTADSTTIAWIRDLFAHSRALPTTAIAQLAAIGGARDAIAYAQQVLESHSDAVAAAVATTEASPVVVDVAERKRVALQLLDLVLREQLRTDVSAAASTSPLDDPSTSSSAVTDAASSWLLQFLETSRDYDTDAVVDRCLALEHVDMALVVGMSRDTVHSVLFKIVAAGLAPFVSRQALATLLARGFAAELTRPSARLVLRSWSVDAQVDVLLVHVPALVEQRDWLLRHLPSISRGRRCRIAQVLDPRDSSSSDAPVAVDALTRGVSDVASSEVMTVRPEERVELFLAVLLSLNQHDSSSDAAADGVSGGDGDDGDGDDGDSDDAASAVVATLYSQTVLEQLLTEFAQQYRPPVMVARCVDYDNWTAAACLYEAHGELVEAVEARLHAHKIRRSVSTLASPTSSALPSTSPTTSLPTVAALQRRRRQSSDASIESAGTVVSAATSDTSEVQDAMRDELLALLESLVVQRHATRAIAPALKAAILARLLVKWFEYGLAPTELEVVLIDPNVYPFVAPLLAKIFFAEVVDSILGGSSSSTDASTVTSATGETSSRFGGFDDRDREWVRKCHDLPFSGQFLFHVCATFLDTDDPDATAPVGTTRVPTSLQDDQQSDGNEPLTLTSARRSATQRLLDLVKANVGKNDVARRAVTLEPHSAQALGKSDPLETHAKVFTCGHVFPKRVFDEEIVPEFAKRMATLPMPLHTTERVLLLEYRRSAVEAPCPICAFNKISALVQQQRKQLESMRRARSSATLVLPSAATAAATSNATPALEYYFLHAQGKQQQQPHRQRNNVTASRAPHQPWRHEPWEWRAVP